MTASSVPRGPYRGRIAPSPTGYLHLGHARTFWTAQERARQAQGTLILRLDDLDQARCKPEFVAAMYHDLRWFGCAWDEGPDCGGPFAPYAQSARRAQYRAALARLRAGGFVYACTCSRKDIATAVQAPHPEDDDEPVYPGFCRNRQVAWSDVPGPGPTPESPAGAQRRPAVRFRVPDGEVIRFVDGNLGVQTFVAGKDFGDFVVWRPDDVPAYQLACVVDDAAMQITEVVRGADLLKSTARQLLLYRALNWTAPRFFHGALLLDARGQRLAKRHDALSLRALGARGKSPEAIRATWEHPAVRRDWEGNF
ncbi:MAG TPA: tRNA glutamyl-Q(34) synthetase GluQRS [Verrucomicrobiota bacterium]|nr:tRNA glutamyl-Q(34) synthetase GluQRS [Verrucomicrobiota bacterium]HNT14699.1 tRNA glutamyl-Q(34) synthetase GluQRS [Verrucomicrobiota bacterium]